LEFLITASVGHGTPAQRLTPRQREVLQLVAEGKNRKEIATILDITVKTVEFHKATLRRDLNLRTIADYTRYAIAHGMIDSGFSPEK
jgi:DNA-binding NarL/FixJ family response regulator